MGRLAYRLGSLAAVISIVALTAAACSSSDDQPASAVDVATESDTDAVADDAVADDSMDDDATDGDTTASDDDGEDGHHHAAEPLEVTFSPVPSIDLDVLADPLSGWNVHAVPTGHRLAPEHVSTDAVDGEGHMHVYVDGERINRMYGEWYHLGPLGDGDHAIRVELSANNHQALSVDGTLIDATVTVSEIGSEPIDGTDEAMVDMSDDDDDHDDHDQTDHDAIEVTVAGDAVTGGGPHEVATGAMVTIRVESDVADEVHVHGYDLVVEVGPDAPAEIRFEASLPGVWEVELEQLGLLLVELQVS